MCGFPPSLAGEAGKADGWISPRWRVAGSLWLKDKEARAWRGWQENGRRGELREPLSGCRTEVKLWPMTDRGGREGFGELLILLEGLGDLLRCLISAFICGFLLVKFRKSPYSPVWGGLYDKAQFLLSFLLQVCTKCFL